MMEQQASKTSPTPLHLTPKRRTTSWLVWSFWGLVIGCAVISLVWRTQNSDVLFASDTGAAYLADLLIWNTLVPLAVPSYAIVGAALALRRETQRIGWLCLIFALATAMQDICWQYAYRTFVVARDSLPAGQVFGLAAGLLNDILAFFPYILILLLFPTGHFLSPRWRLIAALAGLCTLGLVLFNLFAQSLLPAAPVANPLHVKALEGIAGIVNGVGFWVLTLLFLSSMCCVIVRWRLLPRAQHRQLTWLAWMGVAVIGIWLTSVVVSPLLPMPYLGLFLDTIVHASLSLGLPVALGIALLRYRLYEGAASQ